MPNSQIHTWRENCFLFKIKAKQSKSTHAPSVAAAAARTEEKQRMSFDYRRFYSAKEVGEREVQAIPVTVEREEHKPSDGRVFIVRRAYDRNRNRGREGFDGKPF